MLTALLILLPVLGAICLLPISAKAARGLALVVSTVVCVLSIYMLMAFDSNGGFQFQLDFVWIKSLGIHFKLGLDGISILLVLLTTVLTPLIVLTSFRKERTEGFYALILIMESGLLGVFASMDGFMFYIFWELALLPAYLICLFWGGEKRILITFRFFIYTLAGSLLMLAALIILYLHTPAPHSFTFESLYAVTLPVPLQAFIFWAFFIAFAIKMPVFPFHTWQPDTYTDAPSQGTMLLSGIMLKMGIYGLLRLLLPLCPDAVHEYGPIALMLSIAGIVYASLIAWMQKDLKRLAAYASIAHVGLISAGIFTLSAQGLQGAMVQMLSHGVVAVGLFFVCQIIAERVQSHSFEKLGGIRSISPVFAGFFLVILFASIGLPLTSGFIGEFLLLFGLFQLNFWYSAVAGLSVILGAVYMLNAYKKVMLGPDKFTVESFEPLSNSEIITLAIICILIVGIGLCPNFVFNIAGPSLEKIRAIAHL